MSQQPFILIHEKSLRMTHPVFQQAPAGTQVIYIWDDRYIKESGYSLKRLVFIYETLCGLSLDILHGDTLSILQEINPSLLYVPSTNHPLLLNIIHAIQKKIPIEIVADEPFVNFKNPMNAKRFFQYWKHAEKTAFLYNGDDNA